MYADSVSAMWFGQEPKNEGIAHEMKKVKHPNSRLLSEANTQEQRPVRFVSVKAERPYNPLRSHAGKGGGVPVVGGWCPP